MSNGANNECNQLNSDRIFSPMRCLSLWLQPDSSNRRENYMTCFSRELIPTDKVYQKIWRDYNLSSRTVNYHSEWFQRKKAEENNIRKRGISLADECVEMVRSQSQSACSLTWNKFGRTESVHKNFHFGANAIAIVNVVVDYSKSHFNHSATMAWIRLRRQFEMNIAF